MNDKITEIKDEHARVEKLYEDDPTKIDKLDQAHDWIGYLLQLVETQSKALEEQKKSFETIHGIASETFESCNQLELIRLTAAEHF